MCHDDKNLRREHFSDNWLVWTALRHFLTAPLIRELAYVIVDRMSNGSLNLAQLFDETIYGTPDCLASWLIRPIPLEMPSPLATYLQLRIRTFAWQSDLGYFSDFTQEENVKLSCSISPSTVDRAVGLGSADFELTEHILKNIEDTGQTSFSSMVCAFELARTTIMSSTTDEFVASLETSILSIEMPLAAVILKHFGDLCADADAWNKAKALYEKADQRLAANIPSAWDDLNSSLRAIIVQSRATAIFTLNGAKPAADLLTGDLDQHTIQNAPVLLANASFDAFVTANMASGSELKLPLDHRATLLLPPMLHKTHSVDSALEYWLEGKFTDANRQFWAVLRRQIALGSAVESRTTKSLYARSIFDEIDQSATRQNQPKLFKMAIRLLIESGNSNSAVKIHWSEQIVDTYVNQQCVDFVVAHSQAHAGAQLGRQLVVIALFQEWCTRINLDHADVATSMLKYVTTLALEPSSFYSGEDMGGKSFETLKYIAQRRPELRRNIVLEVATAVSEKLRECGFWTGTQKALETALSYMDVFPDDALQKVINSTLAMLDQTNPQAGMWLIVRPAMNLLVSESVKRFSTRMPALGPRIISTILRFGLGHENEHANVMFYLHHFDSTLLRDPSVQNTLKDVIAHIRTKATKINSSDVVSNILALLYAPSVSRQGGVKDALKGMTLILESAKKPRPSIALPIAYEPLLLLAGQQQQIATDISIDQKEFGLWLKPLLPLVIELWNAAKDRPLLFASFSLPPATKPDPIIVHNWAFASIRFAEALKKDKQLKAAIVSAETQPTLRDAIILARATRSTAKDDNTPLNINAIRSENRDAFYPALGRRLLALQRLDNEQARDLCMVLLDQCLRLGPRELDAAVFLSAMQLNINGYNKRSSLSDYRIRLNNNRDLRLAILPILHAFEDNKN